MKRVAFIIDTNIVVAGLITNDANSPPARIVDAMLNGDFIYLMSTELLTEYAAVLQRPKLLRLHGLTVEEIDCVLTELVANSSWREPGVHDSAPDPGDDHLWALLSSNVKSLLVTGDRLLIENPPGSDAVISARDFVDLYLPPDTA